MSYGVHDFMTYGAELERQLRAALANIDHRGSLHRGHMNDLEAQLAAALAQLVRVLLPDASAASLQRAARLAGHGRFLVPAETTLRLEAERTDLRARIAALEADPRFRDRQLLRAPRVGTLARQLAELEDFSAPMADLLHKAHHPRLLTLLENGYGSDGYAVPFWRLSYYSDWKAGDEILERFPDKKSFAELRPELLTARDTLAVYDQRIDALRAEIAEGEAVERAHAEATARLANLDAIYLEDWRQDLARHLREQDPVELGDRFAGEEAAALLYKTYVGLRKKGEYLTALQQQLEDQRDRIQDDLTKLERDRVKLSRPKKAGTRFDAARFEKRFADRRERHAKLWKRYDRTYDTVWGFQSYERASLVEDFLWWDLFTDGQLDGNFIPEVQEFHQHHPGYSWHERPERHDPLDDDLTGAAAVASLESDRGDAGGTADLHDPS